MSNSPPTPTVVLTVDAAEGLHRASASPCSTSFAKVTGKSMLSSDVVQAVADWLGHGVVVEHGDRAGDVLVQLLVEREYLAVGRLIGIVLRQRIRVGRGRATAQRRPPSILANSKEVRSTIPSLEYPNLETLLFSRFDASPNIGAGRRPYKAGQIPPYQLYAEVLPIAAFAALDMTEVFHKFDALNVFCHFVTQKPRRPETLGRTVWVNSLPSLGLLPHRYGRVWASRRSRRWTLATENLLPYLPSFGGKGTVRDADVFRDRFCGVVFRLRYRSSGYHHDLFLLLTRTMQGRKRTPSTSYLCRDRHALRDYVVRRCERRRDSVFVDREWRRKLDPDRTL